MRCEMCHGLGRILADRPISAGPPIPLGAALPISVNGRFFEVTCAECNGSGIAHCCDGLCAQELSVSGREAAAASGGAPPR